MDERPIAVVTGAAGGIGRQVVLALARADWGVVAVTRSVERGAHLNGFLQTEGQGPVSVEVCDLSSLDDVRALGRRLSQAHPHIDRLVHNAAMFTSRPTRSPDGFDLQLAVNYLAPWVLTEALTDRMEGGRVILVASEAWRRSRVERVFDDGVVGMSAYRASKHALVLYGVELARRGVDVASVHPGVVATTIGSQHSHGVSRAVWSMVRRFARHEVDGAAPVVSLAVEPELPAPSGTYYNRHRPQPGATDPFRADARALWDRTRAVLG